ncbi:MAG: 3'-5' exonuclease, partial [Candidatus Omnitrophota bacterium]
PSLGKKDLYYVYLMWRQGLGWRLGVTNDLAGRLRLERSADKIIGIRCCATEEEASFYEVLYSLKYGIPTVCFMMREDIFVSGPWLERLYQEIDTQKAATKLANDFGIDLNSHHFCLGAVVRGNKARIKIKLELCFRKNTLKQPRGKLLKNPNVLHLVSLETSDAGIISKLKAAGFALRKTKKGMGWKKSSVDIQKLGAIADRLQKITNGIIEYKFRVGTRNITHGAALVMPASNVLRGHYLPVYRKGRILYERIAKVTSQIKTLTVYDLEIARTHNFIANGVVVHNSIYKWRGAAVSNILNFDSTYPKAKKISLTQNYRSTQKILDSAYQLIQQNNPDRFEVKANINKRLKGATVAGEPIKHLHFDSVSSEADAVAEVIAKKIESKKFHYNDFAILVRSNSDAEPFLRSLNMRGIPWRFSGSQGLYTREEIRLGIAFLKIIANPSDSLSLFYLCNSPLYALPIVELTQCMHYCRRRNEPLFFVLRRARQIEEFRDFPEDFFQAAEKLIAALEGYLKDAKNLTAGRLLYSFLSDSGYLKALAKEATAENEEKLKNLAEFFDMVRNFEMVAHEDRVMYFVNYLEMLIEAGDDPATAQAEMDVDAVNVLTIHKAKGLEFTVVFLVGLVKGRFPLPHRHQALELPEKLIKDILPSGDFHIQEERRLFYVGMTRAKKELYLTSAVDYGTERARKISPFVYEALGTKAEEESRKASPLEKIGRCAALSKPAAAAERPIDKDGILTLSYYQVDDYLTCPLKYKYVHVLRVPIMIHHSVLYGKALHDAVQFYHQRKIKGEAVSKDEVLAAFENSFKPEGFLGREHLEQRLTAGREAIGRFFRQQEQVKIIPKLVEKDFSFVLGQNRIIGRWDRIDERKEGVVIVDFKSSQIHKQKDADTHTKESLQLAIYCLAYQNIFNKLPDFQELHFLESGLIGRFKPEAPRLKKAEEEIAEAAEGVRIRDYTAKPSAISCNYCPYNLICPSAWRRPR